MNREPNEPFDAATTVEYFPEGNDPNRPLVVVERMRDAILAHLQDSLPNEGCGLLAAMSVGDVDLAVRFYPGANTDHSPVRYTMKAEEVIAAQKDLREMRDQGWFLGAIVHSHPHTEPAPSRTDLKESYYPAARMLIVSFAGGTPAMGCWTLAGDREARTFRASELVVQKG